MDVVVFQSDSCDRLFEGHSVLTYFLLNPVIHLPLLVKGFMVDVCLITVLNPIFGSDFMTIESLGYVGDVEKLMDYLVTILQPQDLVTNSLMKRDVTVQRVR